MRCATSTSSWAALIVIWMSGGVTPQLLANDRLGLQLLTVSQ